MTASSARRTALTDMGPLLGTGQPDQGARELFTTYTDLTMSATDAVRRSKSTSRIGSRGRQTNYHFASDVVTTPPDR